MNLGTLCADPSHVGILHILPGARINAASEHFKPGGVVARKLRSCLHAKADRDPAGIRPPVRSGRAYQETLQQRPGATSSPTRGSAISGTPCVPDRCGGISSLSQGALGTGGPDITLRVYAHLFRNDDGKAAAINAALAR